jgi:hypothetical protein
MLPYRAAEALQAAAATSAASRGHLIGYHRGHIHTRDQDQWVEESSPKQGQLYKLNNFNVEHISDYIMKLLFEKI